MSTRKTCTDKKIPSGGGGRKEDKRIGKDKEQSLKEKRTYQLRKESATELKTDGDEWDCIYCRGGYGNCQHWGEWI